MKSKNWKAFPGIYALPVLLMLLGILLIVKPDSAAALIGKAVALVVILSGTVMGVTAMSGETSRRIRRLIPAAIALALGLWLLVNPLFIAESLGRILGILLLLEGGSELIGALRRSAPFPVMAFVTLVAGVVLVLLPMTTSRLLITVCGIVVLCIGAAELAEKLLRRQLPPKADILDEA